MLFSSPQDVASHQPKELVARIEGGEWSGKLHLGRFEARIVLVKVFCCVFFPWSGPQAIFVACLRRGRFAISFFFVFATLFLFFLIFSSKKQVPMVNLQGWLTGTRWDGMPCHVTLGHPGWWVTSEQVEARSVFSLLVFVVSYLSSIFLWMQKHR